jgi:hypothetical protein
MEGWVQTDILVRGFLGSDIRIVWPYSSLVSIVLGSSRRNLHTFVG